MFVRGVSLTNLSKPGPYKNIQMDKKLEFNVLM